MHTLILLPAQFKDQANAIAADQFDPSSPAVFRIALYPVAQTPQSAPTYYWCAAKFSAEKRATLDLVKAMFDGAVVRDYDQQLQPDYPRQVLTEFGLISAASALQS